MVCESLNSSSGVIQNWDECYKGLDEYGSGEELAHVDLFAGYPDELMQFSAACCFIFMIIGIPGNIVTIVALSKYRKVRNATAFFIINLSVSDLLFAIMILPITIALFLNKSWTTGKLMCLIFPTINYGLTATSVFTIVAITLNRYVMVSHPIHYPKLYQTRNLVIMIIAIWVSAFGMLVPIQSEIWGRFSLDPKVGYCSIIPDKNKHTPKMAMVVMGFIFPCIFIVTCYCRIMYIVKKSTRKSTSKPPISNVQSDTTNKNQKIFTRELTSSGNTQEEDNIDDVETNTSGVLFKFKATFRRKERKISNLPTRRDKRLQTMIIVIIISFFACHLPIMIAKTASNDFAAGPYGNMMGYLLLYLTVCSNPIIYVVMSSLRVQTSLQKYISLFEKTIEHPTGTNKG